MGKRILAFICMLALLIGMLAVGAAAQTDDTPDTYLVGYAKRDINPWVDPEDHSKGVLPVLLTGNGNDASRACDGLMDDNGDGEVDENDGLFTTCTAVTDANGTTVFYITLDTLQGEPTAVSDIRNSIMKTFMDTYGESMVNGNQIMISGSHTHSAPSLQKVKNEYKDTYYKYIIDQVTAAAVAAYDDRAAATMKRGSVDATEATATMGYNSGSGYQMNFLRHFQITAEYSALFGWIKDEKSYVVGSSFSTGSTTVGGNAALDDYKVTAADHVAEADNTMHLLQFEFVDKDSDKEPVVLVNWRAHPTTISGGDTKTLVSSDYVNALRYQLENSESGGYRVAFFQGAGANTSISSRYHIDWTAECPTPGTADTNVYGELLANVAEYCLKNSMTDELPCGDIRIIQRTFKGELQKDSEGLQAAADNAPDSADQYPYSYTYTDKKQYIINSVFHRNAIRTRKQNSDRADFTTQEIAVVSLGDYAAFVTAPNELSDRYDLQGSLEDKDNDWLNLINEKTYGTPFVITHANGNKGYLPNTLNYSYNLGVKDLSGNPFPLGVGSYEANTSHYKSGTGEALIETFCEMLAKLDSEEEKRRCEACDADVVWKPVSYLQLTDSYLGSGHYYLAEDISSNIQKTVRSGERLCLDLNGHNITITGRTLSVEAGGTLNIFDSGETGSVTSIGASNNVSSGTFSVSGIMNIYGGTFACEQKGSVSRGGVVGVNNGGRLNMYGGAINATDLVISNFGDSGVGGAIYVAGGEAHFYNDAKVTTGTAPEGGFGPCVALGTNSNSKVYLYDNASVDDIYFRKNNSANLTISGTFTGKVGLSYASDVALDRNTVIGNVADNPDISGATLILPETLKDWRVYIDGSELKVAGYNESTVAVIGENEYESLCEAVENYTEDSVIKLIKDEVSATIVSKNAYLDLNGFNVIGAVKVEPGYTLYCMDSSTDDYDVGVNNDEYGKLTNASGNIKGIPEESKLAEDGYLMVTGDNSISFHRVNLQLTAISLRTFEKGVCAPSVYYKCNFKGDKMVADAVKGYGVALSVQEMPDLDNLHTMCEYSCFTQFAPGSEGNAGNGTLLYGIMKPTNKMLINYRNANVSVYGRSYILTEYGYMFGKGYSRTLKQVVETVDTIWNKIDAGQKANIIQMYNTYMPVMASWDLPNLKEEIKNAG